MEIGKGQSHGFDLQVDSLGRKACTGGSVKMVEDP
jgi:hypothetical protein